MPLLRRHQYLEGRPTLVCHRRLDDDRPRRPLRGDNLTGGGRAGDTKELRFTGGHVRQPPVPPRAVPRDRSVCACPTNQRRETVCLSPPASPTRGVCLHVVMATQHAPAGPTDRLTLRHVPTFLRRHRQAVAQFCNKFQPTTSQQSPET